MKRFGWGMLFLIAAYVLFTAFRDFRDNFAAEIWRAMGRGGDAKVFSLSEAPVAAIALAALAGLMWIRSNRLAFFVTHAVMAVGAASIGLATLAYQAGLIDGLWWMIATGAALYVCYTPYNAVLFERLIAATRYVGTAGFLIYVADTAGYVGSIGLLLFKNFSGVELDWLGFFIQGAYIASAVSLVLVVASAVWFRPHLRREEEAARASPA
jgi:hypothetical protein